MRYGKVCGLLVLLVVNTAGWAGEEIVSPRPPVRLSIYHRLTGTGVRPAAPGSPFISPVYAMPTPDRESKVLRHQFEWLGGTAVKTTLYFSDTEPEEQVPAVEPWWLTPEERAEARRRQRLDESAFQAEIKQESEWESLSASFTTVGAEFAEADKYQLQPGARTLSVAGTLRPSPHFSTQIFLQQQFQAALGGRPEKETRREKVHLELRPSDTTRVQVTHERRKETRGWALTREQETLRVQAEQQLGRGAGLSLTHERREGRRTLSLAGMLRPSPRLSAQMSLQRQTQESVGIHPKKETRQAKVQLEARPTDTTRVQVTHERREETRGEAPTRLRENLRVQAEQQLGRGTGLSLVREAQRWGTEERRHEKAATTVRLTAAPADWVRLQAERTRRTEEGKEQEEKEQMSLKLSPFAPLSLAAEYRRQARGEKEETRQYLSVAFQASSTMKVTTDYQARERGDKETVRRSVQLEATPGQTRMKAGYVQEETAGGKETTTASMDLEFQPHRALRVGGAYTQRTDQTGTENVTRSVRMRAAPLHGLTLTGERQVKEREGTEVESIQRIGAETHVGRALTLSATREERRKGEQTSSVLAGQVTLRPHRAVSLTGHYKARERTGQETVETKGAEVVLGAGRLFNLRGSYTLNPEDKKGRVFLGRRAAATLEMRPVRGLSLAGTLAWQAGDRAQTETQEAEFTLSLGRGGRQFYTTARFQRTLSVAQQLNAQYTVGYTHRLGSRFSLSFEGVVEQQRRYLGITDENLEYRGEAKLQIAF